MNELIYILLFTFIGSLGALTGGVILLIKENYTLKISHFLASFAAGTLLGTAFFDLLPEAAHEAEKMGHSHDAIFIWTLAGMILFFLIERFIHWFHHHEEYHTHEAHEHQVTKSMLPLIITSDTLHNFLDGIVIAATFMTSIPLGIVTTFAVVLHEIPQEIGDFGLMLHAGMEKRRIILVNILSAGAAFCGAILTYMLGDILKGTLPAFLAITAGFFIYIASSDLIPEIHHEKRKGFAFIETALLLAGVAIIWLSVSQLSHGH